jgi:hypothetical protein
MNWPLPRSRLLLGAEQEDRDLHQVPHAVGGGAVDDVGQEAVAVRGHRDQVDLASPAARISGFGYLTEVIRFALAVYGLT